MTNQERIKKIETRLEKVSIQRERNVDRYILPLELKISVLRDKIDKLKRPVAASDNSKKNRDNSDN